MPAYACLHLGWWEEEVVYCSKWYLSHALLWLRYIDYMLLIWKGIPDTLGEFIEELNLNIRKIKVTFNYNLKHISFLDLLIRVEQGNLVTSTYKKETAANTLLKATSHHPKSLINGIPMGQFLRICRNCSLESDYKAKTIQLYECFRERKYPHKTLRRSN